MADILPWTISPLSEWLIVGMNHYTDSTGGLRLYVAMVHQGRCIRAEGPDGAMLWEELRHKALHEMSKSNPNIPQSPDRESNEGT